MIFSFLFGTVPSPETGTVPKRKVPLARVRTETGRTCDADFHFHLVLPLPLLAPPSGRTKWKRKWSSTNLSKRDALPVILQGIMGFSETLKALHSKLFGRNLHAVDAGKVYRVARGRMSTPDFMALLADLAIRTAVDLRRTRTSAGDELKREDFEEVGVRFENVHLRSSGLPFPSKLSRFVDIVDGLGYPVLFYCKRGTDKTGFSSMLYLMLEKGEPWERAKRQLRFIPFGHKKRRHKGPWEFMRLLRECAPVADLRAWIRDDYPALFRREMGDEEERALAEEDAG